MKARFAILVLIPLGCATGENAAPTGNYVGGAGTSGAAGTAGDSTAGTDSGTSGSTTTTAGTDSGATGGSGDAAGTSGSDFGGTATAGSFTTAGTATAGSSTTAGTGGTSAGTSSGGAAGTSAGGTSAGTAGKSTGGTAGTGTAGTGTAGTSAGTGGTGTVGDYCATQTPSPLPFTVNDGFQPSGWQGDYAAISATGITPDGCATRPANPVGACSAWRFTPNAVTPAWAGVTWDKMWDAQYTHPPVCIAAGATKVTFQAKGAAGGEVVIVSAAGAPETPITLTNAWKAYSISLAGVQYNTAADGVDSGFFWKVAPPTPAGGPVTFFIDSIQFSK